MDVRGVQTAFLEVTGLSAIPVRVEVFVVNARHVKPGECILSMRSGIAGSFQVSRTETHCMLPVVQYNRSSAPRLDVSHALQDTD